MIDAAVLAVHHRVAPLRVFDLAGEYLSHQDGHSFVARGDDRGFPEAEDFEGTHRCVRLHNLVHVHEIHQPVVQVLNRARQADG